MALWRLTAVQCHRVGPGLALRHLLSSAPPSQPPPSQVWPLPCHRPRAPARSSWAEGPQCCPSSPLIPHRTLAGGLPRAALELASRLEGSSCCWRGGQAVCRHRLGSVRRGPQAGLGEQRRERAAQGRCWTQVLGGKDFVKAGTRLGPGDRSASDFTEGLWAEGFICHPRAHRRLCTCFPCAGSHCGHERPRVRD